VKIVKEKQTNDEKKLFLLTLQRNLNSSILAYTISISIKTSYRL